METWLLAGYVRRSAGGWRLGKQLERLLKKKQVQETTREQSGDEEPVMSTTSFIRLTIPKTGVVEADRDLTRNQFNLAEWRYLEKIKRLNKILVQNILISHLY